MSAYVIEELRDVLADKFPGKIAKGEAFLRGTAFELVDDAKSGKKDCPWIRDPKDVPVLVGAINGDVDILITGDKDFQDLDIEKPVILKPSEFYSLYVEYDTNNNKKA